MSGPTNYQWVITSTNYDGTAAPKSLRFDGIDDYLNLPYMGLYANGSASVVCAITTLSSDSDIVSEANNTNTVPFYRPLKQSTSLLKGVAYRTDANLQTATNPLSSPANSSIRIVSITDTGTDFKLRDAINGQSSSMPYTRGVTTLTNTVIGALVRTTTSNYHNGTITGGIIITKSALSDTDRRRCEQFLASRLSTLGVTLS